MKLPEHGANPHRLYEQAGVEMPKRILDFSENVHPFGPPDFVSAQWPDMMTLITRYPDPSGEPFRSAAAQFHDVTIEQVAAGNGAAEIFTWLARRYRGKRVLLLEPAFSEYRKTLEAEQVEIAIVQLKAENGWRLPAGEIAEAVQRCDALYICNPHNPTGRLTGKEDLLRIADACKTANCELVIDEAFIDFAGEEFSFIPYVADFPKVIIVRSMTKMYAIPGLRLGYAISSAATIKELKEGAAHWNVNVLSATIGARCFEEKNYRRKVMETAKEERLLMADFLVKINCNVTDSVANFLAFRLPETANPQKFFIDMLKKGLVLRHSESFKGMDGEWFRIGMKSKMQMEELREAMKEWLKDS